MGAIFVSSSRIGHAFRPKISAELACTNTASFWRSISADTKAAVQWAWISKYSPYHNVKAGVAYPQVLFTTSTRDDRVHPAHARKMAARMLEQGHQVLYYENIEGGHGGAADNAQRANLQALEFSYLWQRLGNR